MRTLTRKLKVSINKALIDKNVSGDKSLYTNGWENRELTAEELAETVGRGIAYCAQLSGRRRTSNFLASDVVSVDIDGTRSINDALADPIVEQYATILYTTANHSETDPHFRIIFALPRTITIANEMSAAARSLALRLSGDPAAVDASRIYFGSKGAQLLIFDREISPAFLDELIAQSRNPPTRDTIDGGERIASSRSALGIASDQVVKLADGTVVPFAEVKPGSPVSCPFHEDRRPSAFVVSSKRGVKGICCSTCGTTYWPAGSTAEAFDFYDFERVIREIPPRIEVEEVIDFGPLFGQMPRSVFREAKIDIVNGRPAPPALMPGVTLIKSPKGSGKTEAIKGLIGGSSAILIGHRRSLIRQSCERLALQL